MKLGGDQDNQIFRNQLNDKMKKASELMKKFTTDLEDFRNLTVSYDQTKARQDKYEAFNDQFSTMTQKYRSAVADIQQKQKLYMEVLEKRRTLAGNHSVDLDSNASINNDNEKGLRLNQVDKDTIRIKGEVDFNS